MKKIILMAIGILLLSSCDFKVSAPINVSELLDSENKVVLTILKFDLGFRGEEGIKEIEEGLQKRGIKARNLHKTEQDHNSTLALFSIPIEIVKTGNVSKLNQDIYFMFENNELSIHTSDNFSTLLQHETMGKSDNISISEFEISLTNDTDDAVYMRTYSVFVDSKPVLLKAFQLSSYSTVNITLSDVANAQLGNSSVTYTVLQLDNDLEELKKKNTHNLTVK